MALESWTVSIIVTYSYDAIVEFVSYNRNLGESDVNKIAFAQKSKFIGNSTYGIQQKHIPF